MLKFCIPSPSGRLIPDKQNFLPYEQAKKIYNINLPLWQKNYPKEKYGELLPLMILVLFPDGRREFVNILDFGRLCKPRRLFKFWLNFQSYITEDKSIIRYDLEIEKREGNINDVKIERIWITNLELSLLPEFTGF